MKKTLTLLTLVFLTYSLPAQIAGSVKLGLAGYQGDLHCRTDEKIGPLDEINPSFGLGARLPLNEILGLRLEGTFFRLSGDETNFGNAGHNARGWSFKNNFIELAAMLDWEWFGKKRFTETGAFKRTLTPLLFGGVGVNFNNPKVDWLNATVDNISVDRAEGEKIQLAIPVGGGLKYYLSERFALALEGGIRLPVSDYYDGVSLTAGPEGNDLYGFGGVKAYFNLTKGDDEDGDGISSKVDECPTLPGSKELNGCPDTDKDGIADKDDSCPNVAGLVAFQGCPDTDKDGIADKDDECPTIAGSVALAGCPDADNDGVADSNDKCPEIAGTKDLMGCPDSDADGVADSEDDCPNVPGLVDRNGCPLVDTDNDGIEDALDECPTFSGSAATGGCPDTDGDGIADKRDSCPNIAANTSTGCPDSTSGTTPSTGTIGTPSTGTSGTTSTTGTGSVPFDPNADMKSRLLSSSRNITFETASVELTRESYLYLDDIAETLKMYPSEKFLIIGYTDNVGVDLANEILSLKRAKACRTYLISKGISARRLGVRGFGEALPIASNDTEAGRRMNRRVEFVLDDGSIRGVDARLDYSLDCDCAGTSNSIFQIPENKTPQLLTRLGTNPEFGDLFYLDAQGFFDKLTAAYESSSTDRRFLDSIFRAMGYSGFADAHSGLFYSTFIPNGRTGNLGYGPSHQSVFATLDARSSRDLEAFRIKAANGCDIHFMKTCGNHFYFCTK